MDDSLIEEVVFKNVDDILKHTGSYGRFQIMLNIALCVSIAPLSFPILMMYFVALDPPWKCVSNSTVCTWNATMTHDDEERCHMSRSEWEYTEARHFSIITQFDLYCEREWIIHLTTSALFVGWGGGAIIFGWISDNYGRKVTMFPSLLVVIVINFASAFAPNATLFTVARFFIGLFLPGVFYQLFVCMSEFTTSDYRPLSVNMIKCFYPFGLCLLALKAYFIRNWKYLLLACSAPYVFIFSFVFFVPESIRWLHIHEKEIELEKVFRKVAEWNKKTLPTKFSLEPASSDPSSSYNKSNPLDLFRPTRTFIQTMIQGYAWMVDAMIFYGLTLAANDLGGSIYLNFVLLSISEIPGFIAAIYFCRVAGRKETVCMSTIFASLFCIGVTFVPSIGMVKIIRVSFGVIGKIFVAIAYSSILIWSLELYPTNTRSQAIGFLQFTSRIGSASAPWIAKALKHYYHGAPFLVMGVSIFIGALFLVTLPETQGKSTLETKEDQVASEENGELSHELLDDP